MHDKIFLKRVLIPLWVIQILVLLAFAAAAGLALYAVDEVHFDDSLEHVLDVAAAVQLSFSVFTIIMDIVEIILAASHRLGPVANIVMQCIKSAIWTVFFIIVIRGAVVGSTTGLTIILVLVLFLTCIAQLIYGAVIVHRHRKGTLHRGNYSLAAGGNVHGNAYTSPYNAPPTGSYAAYNSSAPPPNPYGNPSPAAPGYSAPYPESADTAYKTAGATHDYYGSNAHPNTYEMHGNSGRY